MSKKFNILNDVYIFTIATVNTQTSWYLIPTISIIYNRYGFLETGVYTPKLSISVNFLKFSLFAELQKTY